ncbi:hypothetical protein PUR71_07145 [Streptomyces sp. SP17BM10]|uniref:hypothetical protein n=1 Tax=Streptomyces sp. SP17BM10 TaxID=3002530 RepID=UPI002E765DF8|nr:hypothetical protein [Streptomyces sp. SP17BM10]MEE1782698.1 hypothetical protein [Streptomyces sp. SP17BM10]
MIALAVTGCSSTDGAKGSQDNGGSSGTPSSSASAQAKPIGAPGTVTVSWCDLKGGNSGAPTAQQLTLASYSMTDGQEVARTVSLLPQGADTGILCDSTPTGHTSVPSAVRQAFNKDFTLVAGVMPPVRSGASSQDGPAVAFTLKPQSTPVGAPSADPFTIGAKDRTPAFQSGTSTLWYETHDRHVMSRDLGQPGAAATDHGMSHDWGFVLAGDQPWSRMPLGDKFKDVTVNPSGTAAAAAADDYNSAIWLKDSTVPGSGDEYAEPLRFGPAPFGSANKALPGGDNVPQCTPKFWIDDHSLFCAGKGFSRVVFSDALDSVQKVEQLLPDNDRDNSSVAPSPDLKSVVFLSRQGKDVAELYRLDLSPGSTPKKISSIAPHGPSVNSELRLVAWQ